MKRKFPATIAIGFVLVLGTASGIRLFGQQNGTGPDRPNNSGPQTNDQLPPARILPGRDGVISWYPAQQPNYVQSQQGYPSPPFANGQPMEGNGQRMVPHTYTTRTPDGREVTATTMRPEGSMNRLNASHQVLREAQTKLRSPDASDSDKKEARESIAKFLKEEFERDQKTRREQVERLEEHVSKLRKQLDKRQDSQSKIIELRMQLLENEAEGLAFPDAFNELNGFSGGPQLQNYPGPIVSQPYPSNPPYAIPYPQRQYGFGSNPGDPQPQYNSPPISKSKKDQPEPNVAKPIENRS